MKEFNNEKNIVEENRYEQLSRKARFSIFAIFIALSIAMNCDIGVLSSSKKQVRRDLQLDEKGFGFFSSFVFFGRLFGSYIFMDLFQKDKRKFLTFICTSIMGGAFFAYSLTYNIKILYFIRFLYGSAKFFLHIYVPAWIDQFGIKNHKLIMMIILNISSPLGQAFGYVLGTINQPDKWYINYKIAGCLILALGSLLLLFPSKFFSTKYHFVGYKEKDEEEFVRQAKHSRQESFFEISEMKVKKKSEGRMIEVLKNPLYFFSALTKAIILLCFQTIHFNITSYVIDDLRMPEEEKITIFLPLYVFALVFGPFVGGMFGGLCVSSVGGYGKKSSAYLLASFALITLFSSWIVIYSDTAIFMCIGLLFFFFFASALLPIISGYIVSSISREHKGAGSSLNLLITILLGSIPGPIIYGYLKEKFRENNPRLPWKINAHIFAFGFVSSLASAFFSYKKISKEEEENKGKEE